MIRIVTLLATSFLAAAVAIAATETSSVTNSSAATFGSRQPSMRQLILIGEQASSRPKHIAEAGHNHKEGSHNHDSEPKQTNSPTKNNESSAPNIDEHGTSDDHDHGQHGHNGPQQRQKMGQSKSASQKKNGHDHKGEHDHKDHDDHGHEKSEGARDSHSEHDDSVTLTKEQMREFGVSTQKVGSGSISISLSRPAEVKFNENYFAHVVPRVAGIVEEVTVSEGETVQEGQVIARLDSRELAESKAAYLAAFQRHALAKDNFRREESLQRKRITSEKALSTSKTRLAEARIELRSTEQKLFSLGFDKQVLKELASSAEADLTAYTMRAPLSGRVIERHLVRGETATPTTKAFTIADVSTIWVDISIYPGDLKHVRTGQNVTIKKDDVTLAEGQVQFVSPHVSEDTRTGKARVVLDNKKSLLQPGLFVKAEISISKNRVAARIPKSALQHQDGKMAVFVADGEKFEQRFIETGQQDNSYVEVASGLKPGEIVVVEGAFVIKSQLSKASFGDGHNH